MKAVMYRTVAVALKIINWGRQRRGGEVCALPYTQQPALGGTSKSLKSKRSKATTYCKRLGWGCPEAFPRGDAPCSCSVTYHEGPGDHVELQRKLQEVGYEEEDCCYPEEDGHKHHPAVRCVEVVGRVGNESPDQEAEHLQGGKGKVFRWPFLQV